MSESLKMRQLAKTALERYHHVCLFYTSKEEEYRLVRSFVRDGFPKGDKAFHIIDERSRAEHLQFLEELGIDVTAAQTTGQLEVRGWENAHLRPGYFDQHAMLALVEEVLTESKRGGFPFTRWVANMGWALTDLPGAGDLVEYCTRLNYVTPKYEATILCTYDYAKFDVGAVIDVLRTHPAAIIGGILHENPFFVSPDELLREQRERAERAART